MPTMFDSDEVQVSSNIDRKKLPVGRYLVTFADAREVVGGFKGARWQLDFHVNKGPGAEPGTLKSDVIMQQIDPAKRKKDNYKIQCKLAAFGNVKPSSITNENYGKMVRDQKVKTSSDEGTKILKESCAASDLLFFDKQAVLVVKPYYNPRTKKASCFYEFEPYTNTKEVFADFDPSLIVPDEEPESVSNEAEEALEEATKAASEDEAPPAPPEEEEEPLTKAAKDGWKANPKGKGWFYKGKEQLKEADLIKKYS